MKLVDWVKPRINWNYLSSNPNAVRLLEQNIDKVNWKTIWANQNIFEMDMVGVK